MKNCEQTQQSTQFFLQFIWYFALYAALNDRDSNVKPIIADVIIHVKFVHLALTCPIDNGVLGWHPFRILVNNLLQVLKQSIRLQAHGKAIV